MPVPTIYFIRHGETSWNAEKRFQGTQDIPLNDVGRAQAVAAGRILGNLLARERREFSSLAFVASPLSRARSTMELLRRSLQLSAEEYVVDDRLREIAYGEWEGLTLLQIEQQHAAAFTGRNKDKWHIAPPSGESYVGVTQRVRDWLGSVITDTVAVAHNGTMRALMVALGAATPVEANETFIGQGVVYVFNRDGLREYS
jgi:broad specificity phosphatase PhoE